MGHISKEQSGHKSVPEPRTGHEQVQAQAHPQRLPHSHNLQPPTPHSLHLGPGYGIQTKEQEKAGSPERAIHTPAPTSPLPPGPAWQPKGLQGQGPSCCRLQEGDGLKMP